MFLPLYSLHRPSEKESTKLCIWKTAIFDDHTRHTECYCMAGNIGRSDPKSHSTEPIGGWKFGSSVEGYHNSPPNFPASYRVLLSIKRAPFIDLCGSITGEHGRHDARDTGREIDNNTSSLVQHSG